MILDQFGRQYPARKRPEERPLAAAPILDTWREYVAAGLTPQRLATIFKEADAGDMARQAQLFEQMEERDGHLLGEIGKRRNAVLDIEFAVRPASDDARDQKVADFVQEFLDDMTDFDDVMVSLQDAVGHGFAALEIQWDTSEGQALPRSLDFIEQKRFRFTDATGYLRKVPLLLTDDAMMGMELPPWKVLLHSYGGKSGHPTRSGILRVCAWWFLFKNYSVKDWVAFAEVFGMPLRLGKYDQGATKADREALMTAISMLGSDAAGIISKSTEIEFIESKGTSTSADLYEKLATFGNKEMSKAILGQTLTAEVGDKGSYAAALTHNEVRLDLAKADTKACAATVRHQLIRPIVGFNFGWDTPVPGYEPAWEEEEDLKEKAEWMGSLLDRGVEMPVSYIRQEFNIPEPEKGEAVVGTRIAELGTRNPAAGGTISKLRVPSSELHARYARIAAKAALTRKIASKAGVDTGHRFTDEQEALEALVGDSASQAARGIALNERTILEAVQSSGSYEEAFQKVMELYPDLDMDGLSAALEAGMLNADMFGKWTVQEELDRAGD